MYSTCLWDNNVSNGKTFTLKQKWRGYSRYSHLSMNFRSQFLNTCLLYISIKNSLRHRILFICARMSTSSHIYVWQLFGNSKVQPSIIVLLKKKEMKLIYSMRKRNSQISISNFKFNFNRKILKMCTSKFFHVLYIHMCVYLYIEMLMYHTYSQNLSGNISVHYFPHTYDIVSLKMSIIISLKIILHLFHHYVFL